MTEAIEERANTVRTTDRTSLTMDERIGLLFQSDSLLVAQYFETLRKKNSLRAGEEAHVSDSGGRH